MKHRGGGEDTHFLGLDERQRISRSYARELRAIGQALEAKKLESLELELEGGIYVARGKVDLTKTGGPSVADMLRDVIGSLFSGASAGPGTNLELRFTTEEIERLDRAARERRRDSSQTPDAYSLSQLLRGAGAYMDKHRKASLIGISVHDRWVTLRYRTADGRIEEAKQDIEFFYNYWVKMYLQRRNRGGASAGPQVIISLGKPTSG